MIEFDDALEQSAKIKVIGVGGGGGNALNTMIDYCLEGVDFIAANTDAQALASNLAPYKVQMGGNLTKGLGAGANPDVGRNAAIEDQGRIAEMLDGADMVFVTAGMGGGTGTGAAPIISRIARDVGALTVGVVTKPFVFEGKKRRRQAEEGIAALKEEVDTLIVIPNQRLLAIATENCSMIDSFKKADEVLFNAVKGISDLIVIPGLINVDFADVKTIMSGRGLSLMGTGVATGEKRAMEAAQQAISSPLLEDVAIDGATGILINITGGPDLTLFEVNEASCLIQEAAHEDANIIFGSVIDHNMGDQVKITVIATGFGYNQDDQRGESMSQLRNQQYYVRDRERDRSPRRVVHAPPSRSEMRESPSRYQTQPQPRPSSYNSYSERANSALHDRPASPPRDYSTVTGYVSQEEKEYDIPTFLRKQAD